MGYVAPKPCRVVYGQSKAEAALGIRGRERGMGRRLVPGVNDLATTHPDLAAEALFDPTALSAGSNRMVPWRCAKGHEWDAQPNNRTNGTGCPVCSGNRLLPGYNDLATTYPHLAAEALFDPSAVSPGSNTKMPWRCARGHEWKVSPNERTGNERGCPYCANKAVLPGFNDLATTHPELSTQAQFDPATVTSGSHRNLPWRCEKGHDWSAVVKSRSIGGTGCPICANQTVLPGYNDLATTRPDLASEARFDPMTVTSGTSRKLPWTCAKGHEWEATVASRTNGAGCPVCCGKAAWPGYNDLATTHPHLAGEALFDLTTVTAGSHRPVPWRCVLGHEWSMSAGHRTSSRQGCPYCANRRILRGFNDLATTHPELIGEAQFNSATVTFGSNQRVPWRCALGHDWTAPVVGRTSNGEGCPVCANRVVMPGNNDLATTHPQFAAEALFDPTTVVGGSHKRLPWLCHQCGHKWLTTPNARVGGTNCPVCAPTGYNPGEAAWLYLFGHEKWGMLQVGITNDPDRRTREHVTNGWHLIDIRGPMDGSLTQAWERSILDFLKARKIPTTPSTATEEPSRAVAARGRKSGEAWWRSDFDISSITRFMALIHDSEETDEPT